MEKAKKKKHEMKKLKQRKKFKNLNNNEKTFLKKLKR